MGKIQLKQREFSPYHKLKGPHFVKTTHDLMKKNEETVCTYNQPEFERSSLLPKVILEVHNRIATDS